MTKPAKCPVRPVKSQIHLHILTVWRVFTVHSMGNLGPRYLHADSEDSDQTGQIPGWSESSLGAQVTLLVLYDFQSHIYGKMERAFIEEWYVVTLSSKLLRNSGPMMFIPKISMHWCVPIILMPDSSNGYYGTAFNLG